MRSISIDTISHTAQGKYVGDRSQSRGIQKALVTSKIARGWDIHAREWQREELDAYCHYLSELQDHTISVCILSGVIALETVKALRKNPASKQLTIIWSAHRYEESLVQYSDYIDAIIMPKHEVTCLSQAQKSTLNTPIIEVLGVAHNLNKMVLEEELEKWESSFTDDIRYLAVFLGGDASARDGKTHCFTPKEATLLGQHVAQRAKAENFKIIATNSPRTGKHDPDTGDVVHTHHDESHDATSAAFIAAIEAENAPYQFFHFQFGKPSAYRAILAEISLGAESIAYVTGDSTSMISEIDDFVGHNSLHIVQVGSMRPVHIAHMESMYEAGHSHKVLLNTQSNTVDITPLSHITDRHILTASEQAAKHIEKAISC